MSCSTLYNLPTAAQAPLEAPSILLKKAPPTSTPTGAHRTRGSKLCGRRPKSKRRRRRAHKNKKSVHALSDHVSDAGCGITVSGKKPVQDTSHDSGVGISIQPARALSNYVLDAGSGITVIADPDGFICATDVESDDESNTNDSDAKDQAPHVASVARDISTPHPVVAPLDGDTTDARGQGPIVGQVASVTSSPTPDVGGLGPVLDYQSPDVGDQGPVVGDQGPVGDQVADSSSSLSTDASGQRSIFGDQDPEAGDQDPVGHVDDDASVVYTDVGHQASVVVQSGDTPATFTDTNGHDSAIQGDTNSFTPNADVGDHTGTGSGTASVNDNYGVQEFLSARDALKKGLYVPYRLHGPPKMEHGEEKYLVQWCLFPNKSDRTWEPTSFLEALCPALLSWHIENDYKTVIRKSAGRMGANDHNTCVIDAVRVASGLLGIPEFASAERIVDFERSVGGEINCDGLTWGQTQQMVHLLNRYQLGHGGRGLALGTRKTNKIKGHTRGTTHPAGLPRGVYLAAGVMHEASGGAGHCFVIEVISDTHARVHDPARGTEPLRFEPETFGWIRFWVYIQEVTVKLVKRRRTHRAGKRVNKRNCRATEDTIDAAESP